MDIKSKGSFFTWSKIQDPTTRVFSRLDRFLINKEWLSLYPESYAYFLNEGLFDHNPCVCYRRSESPNRKPHFKYFNMWGATLEFKNIVQVEWGVNVPRVKMFQVITKLKGLKRPLKQLNKNQFSEIEKSVEVARVILDDIQTNLLMNPTDGELIQAERDAAATYYQLHTAQLSFLKQKSKVEWLKAGDENTSTYQNVVTIATTKFLSSSSATNTMDLLHNILLTPLFKFKANLETQ
ncbi:uncharacterized protein LOC141601643 [Silene latifolia]|uniref:uncharacterized protein LOC141601643 n=1 Tax=Silene latifolia TaxID=37657 RepID=UPI003D76D2F8